MWGHAYDRPWQSMVFFTLATMQFGIALGVRARPGTLRNPFLLVAVATSFLLQLASLYLPALRQLLDTHALSAAEVGASCLLAVVAYAAARLTRRAPAQH